VVKRLLLAALVLVAAAAAFGVESDERVTMSADEQEWAGDTWRGVGNVRILYQDVRISCEEMEWDRLNMDVTARGNVVLDQGPRRFSADEMHYNLRTKTGSFVNASGGLPPDYYFTAGYVEKIDETHYRLRDATFTGCEPEERPPWAFRSRRAFLEEEGYGKFYRTTLRVKGVPVFYLPYLMWPVKQERTSGMMVPGMGYSERRGGYLGLSYFLALHRTFDTTIGVDMFTEGHFGIANQWRWAPKEDAYGQIDLYTIRDADDGVWHWKVRGKHEQNSFLGFRLIAEIDELDDVDFFQEFEREFNRNTLRYLYSYFYLTRPVGSGSLNMRVDRRKTFLSSGDINLAQLPEVELRVRPTRIARSPFYWSLISSANIFNVDRGGDLKGTYGRADFYPSISYSLPGPPWLSLTPRLGGRATYYTKRYTDDLKSFEDEATQRTYFEAGVDLVGPSFSRVFNTSFWGFEKLKHLIEPRVAYNFVSDVGETSQIPRFDEVDSVLVINRSRFTLVNRLFARSAKEVSAREIGSLEIFQDYSFDEPLNYGLDGETSQMGPLGVNLRLAPSRSLTFDARSTYDTLYSNFKSASLAASAAGGPGSINLTWYSSFSPQTGERTSSQIRAMLGFGGRGKPFQARYHISYDIEKQEAQQHHLVLQLSGSCWATSLEYRDLRFGSYPTRDILLSIDLRGIGQLIEIKTGFDTS